MQDTFDVLLLTGRPASGKSEIIDFLRRLPDAERRSRYHLAEPDVLDDFPMLWTWFEEDDLLSQVFGLPRLHSDPQGYFLYPQLWHLLIERLCLEYGKRLRDDPAYHERHTALIEFSRGASHGGYAGAFGHLSAPVLERAGLLYISVSYEESLRKNRRRFNPQKPDSLLEHGLSDEKMERLYKEDDFTALAPGDSGWIEIRGHRLPYAVFPNQDDVTTARPDELADRLAAVLGGLWQAYRSRS